MVSVVVRKETYFSNKALSANRPSAEKKPKPSAERRIINIILIMPLCCCVPGCKSNYYKVGPSVSVFTFPKEKELREKWAKSIQRKDFVPTKYSAVCVKHFATDAVVEEDKFPCSDGSFVSVPRKKLKLKDGAVPTIFEDQPAEETMKATPKRKDPNERVRRAMEREEQRYQEWCENDKIAGFDDFKTQVTQRNVGPFTVINKDDYLLLCKIDDSSFMDIPKMIVCFKVSSSLAVQVFHNDTCLPSQQFDWCLGKEGVLDKWTKFDCLLSHLGAFEGENAAIKKKY